METTTRGKEKCQMGCVVWKGGGPHKELGKRGMKKKSVKFELRSVERGGVKDCGMKLRSTARRGCGSTEWN